MSPDGSTKPLPEEKLLRLIRGKDARTTVEPPVLPPAASAVAAQGAGFGSRARAMPWPRMAILGLSAALCVEVVSLLIEVLRPLPAVRVPAVVSPIPPAATAGAGPTPAPEIPSLAASLTHPVFTPGSAAQSSTAKPGMSGSAKQLASRLSLMGIVSGDPGEAVIEDSATKKTYFVTAGQAVVDGATLERVLDHRVILDLDGEKIELTL